MGLAIFALLLALFENAYPTSTELQSLLIFTTATAKDREMEELRGKWSNLASFKSAYSSLVNVGFDQENYWTILLSRGEPDALFHDIQKAIQADDRTKVIVGRPNGIIDRIFLSPFCWRRGATEQMAFVMCNGKLEFAIDERGWEIDEKVEVNEGGMMKEGPEIAKMQRRSVWIDLLPGVRMATALPLQKPKKEDEQKMIKKRNGKKRTSKMKTEEKNVKENEKDDERKGEEEDDQERKEIEKSDEKSKDEEDEKTHLDLEEQKRKCRYRLSCYTQKGIALSEKQRERQQILLAGRFRGPLKGEKKSTMKEAAETAVKKMKAKEEEGKMLREKYKKDGDKVLANFWSELERKNHCKYRKSCYQTGNVPEIKHQNSILKWLGGRKNEGNVEEKEEEEFAAKKFDEMNELKRKMHCQYRRSCMENGGIRVKIQNELDFLRVDLGDTMKAMRKWWEELEKKVEKKEREKVNEEDDDDEKPFTKLGCKYRKSCYESGKLPQHLQGPKLEKDPQDEHAVKVLGGKKVPTSVKELKLFCKYRKSCYVASAEAKHKEAGIDERRKAIIGAVAQNETMLEIEEEKLRRPKPNSYSSHENVEEEEIFVIPNETEELNEFSEEKEMDEDEKNDEEVGKDKKTVSIQMLMKFNRKRRKAAANPKPKMMEMVKIKEEKNKVELKPKQRERKQKRYKIIDVMPLEKPVMFGMDKSDEDGGRKKKEDEDEEKRKEKDEEKMNETEEKQKTTRKSKKYTQEAKKDEEEERKIWAKREVKLSKLECRYRKSCYKNGIVPEWTAKGQQFDLWALLMGIFEEKKSNDEFDDILAWRGMSEKKRWSHCKYRKSCYERMSKKSGSELEGKRKKMESAKIVPPVKKKIKLVEKAFVSASSTRMVDLSTKLQCKYRKSCYDGGNVPRVMEKIVDSIEGGQWNWTGESRCNPWRISCRQAMGLPIKEKAPIGPNGKRLCRKRKTPEENNNNK